jgi:streptomycin 6-kinase
MSEILEKYKSSWGLSNILKVTSTATSDIYRGTSRHGEVILKILNEVGLKDELPGTYFLEKCQGVGCVRLFEFDQRGLLMEFLPGDNLYQFTKKAQEEKANQAFCRIAKLLGKIKVENHEKNFVHVQKLFNIFERVKVGPELIELIELAVFLSKELMSSQDREVLLHGDLHHENVRSRLDGEFVCYDSKGLVGDPSYELATVLKNPWNYPEISHDMKVSLERAKYFSRELGLPYERIIAFAYVHFCLSICWAIEDGLKYDHQLYLAKAYQSIVSKDSFRVI